VGDQETLATYASNGLGVTFIPQSVHNTQIHQQHEFLTRSATCPVQDLFCTRNIYLSTLKNIALPERALEFYTFLTEYLTWTAQLKRFPTREESDALQGKE
jgi:DNA-binding transcriptional LysR family regulator